MSGQTNEYRLQPLVTYDQSAKLDALTIKAGFTEIQLMGQAALATLTDLTARSVLNREKRLIVFAGRGNNGGDGYALAFHAASSLAAEEIHIFSLYGNELRSEAARLYRDQLKNTNVKVHDESVWLKDHSGDSGSVLNRQFLDAFFQEGDVIAEALLGSGQKGEIREPYGSVIRYRPKVKHTWISLDVPAGLTEDTDNYRNDPEIRIPDEIHNYGPKKTAVALQPHIAAKSDIRILSAGFLPASQLNPVFFESLKPADSDFLVFHKKPDFHKYSAGFALFAGGSGSMTGAAVLFSDCFFAAGGGILQAITPLKARPVSAHLPSVMSADYEKGTLISRLKEKAAKAKAVCIGPGLSGEDLDIMHDDLTELIENTACPVVLDAAAIRLLKPDSKNSKAVSLKNYSRCLLTPHAGEWKALGGRDHQTTIELNGSREDYLKIFSEKEKPFVLVKSAVSVLHTPERSIVISNPVSNLATAGSGDCLAGILTAALSRQDSLLTEELICLSLWLLIQSAQRGFHNQAGEFPGLIRNFISDI